MLESLKVHTYTLLVSGQGQQTYIHLTYLRSHNALKRFSDDRDRYIHVECRWRSARQIYVDRSRWIGTFEAPAWNHPGSGCASPAATRCTPTLQSTKKRRRPDSDLMVASHCCRRDVSPVDAASSVYCSLFRSVSSWLGLEVVSVLCSITKW